MTNSSRALIAGAVMGIVMLGGAGTAAADECSCEQKGKSAIASHDAAFAGRVESISDAPEGKTVTLRVFRSWKGTRGKTLTVTTPNACGVSFEQGSDYLVYANGEKDALRTTSCTPTTTLSSASHVVRQLNLDGGHGTAPLRVPASETAREARAKE